MKPLTGERDREIEKLTPARQNSPLTKSITPQTNTRGRKSQPGTFKRAAIPTLPAMLRSRVRMQVINTSTKGSRQCLPGNDFLLLTAKSTYLHSRHRRGHDLTVITKGDPA